MYHRWHLQFPEPDAQPVSKGTAKRVIRAFRPYKRQVSIVATLIVITSAMGVVNPLLIRTVFDTALFPRATVNGRGGE